MADAPTPTAAPAAASAPVASAPASAEPAAAPASASSDSTSGSPSAPSTPDAAPAADPSETSTPPEAVEPVAIPAPDGFDWDGWDGNAEGLPEPLRPWTEGFAKYYGKAADEARKEAERIRDVYSALLDGKPDPRLTELQKKHDELAAQGKSWEEKVKQAEARHDEVLKAWEADQTARAQKYADDYRKSNEWMFDDGPVQAAALELNDAGFDFEDLPVLLRMPPALLERTKKILVDLKERGAQKDVGSYAIQLARADFKLEQPSSSAKLVDAASGRNDGVFTQEDGPTEALSLRDYTARVVARNAKKR